MAIANQPEHIEFPDDSQETGSESENVKEVAALLRRAITAYRRLLEGDTFDTLDTLKARIQERRDTLAGILPLEDETYEPLFAEAADILEVKVQPSRKKKQKSARSERLYRARRKGI